MDTSQFQRVEAGVLINTICGRVKLWEYSRKGPCVDDEAPIRSHALAQAGTLPAVSYIRGCMNLALTLFRIRSFERIEGRLYTSDSYNAAGDIPWLVSVAMPMMDGNELKLSISWRLGMSVTIMVKGHFYTIDVPVDVPHKIASLSGLTNQIVNPYEDSRAQPVGEESEVKHVPADLR